MNLAEDESLSVQLTEDGAVVTVLTPYAKPEVHTPVSSDQPGQENTPTRRGRRTKAQIQADEEAARLAALQEAGGQEEPENPQTPSAEDANATESASSSDAPADPAPVEEEPVVEEEPGQEPEASGPQVEDPTPPADSKPVGSLFANLRRPSNP